MIFHRHNYEDIKRYYANTIIKLPALSGDRLWQIVSISLDEVKMVDVDGMEIYIDLNEEYEVEYPLPGRVVYQTANQRAGLIHRRPAKQYYRGLHKENTSLSCYTADGSIQGMAWSLHTLQEFVDKPCYQDPNTIDPEDGDSWAINPHMAVTSYGRVMVLTQNVALVDWQEKSINMLKPLFKQEVKQAFPLWKML
jgi:hypothetical protein